MKKKALVLNLYEEIKGILVAKYGGPERENGDNAVFSDESITYLAQISAGWALTGDVAEDEIDLKCEGFSPYYISREDNIKNTGCVNLTYTNQSLRERLLNSKPVNTSEDL